MTPAVVLIPAWVWTALTNETAQTNQTGIGVIEEAFKLAVTDLINALPLVFGALAIVSIYAVIAIILTKLVKKLFKVFRIDESMKTVLKEAYFSVTNLVIALIDIGIALLAVYSVTLTLFPQELEKVTVVVEYGARLVSVIFLVVALFITFNAIIYRIRMEAKMKGFIFLLSFFIAIVLLLDMTAISHEVKTALAWGISVGIGISIGVFAAWFFFNDIIKAREGSRTKQ